MGFGGAVNHPPSPNGGFSVRNSLEYFRYYAIKSRLYEKSLFRPLWKYLSSVFSSNSHSGTLSRVILLLHFTFTFSSLCWWCFDICGVDMTITFAFALLKITFVSFDNLEINWISFSILLIRACRWLVLHARYVASSAYCKHSLSGVIYDISATHKLHNIGPNIEPCGTPNSDVKR